MLTFLAGCPQTGADDDGYTVTPSIAAAELSAPAALVVTTDYETGAYSVIRLSDHAVAENIAVIHQDATCRFDPIIHLPVVIARLGSNAIDIIDPKSDWKISAEYSVEAGEERTNPQDFAAVSAQRAYVTRFNSPDLLVVHPTGGEVIETIDLSAYADQDGVPDASWLLHLDGKLYLSLARLEDGQEPVEHSSLLLLNASDGQVEQEIELSAPNPFGRLRYDQTSERLVLIEAGDWDKKDGGIELFDPADNTLSGLIVTEEQLRGDMVDAVLVTEDKGYAIVGRPADSGSRTHLVSFDPSTGRLLSELASAEQWDYASLELSPDGEQLWLADRTRQRSGIRIFDVNDDSEITFAGPIDVGLAPFAICFVPATRGEN